MTYLSLAHARATMPQLRIDPDRLADLLDEIHDEADESAPDRSGDSGLSAISLFDNVSSRTACTFCATFISVCTLYESV